MITEFAPAKLNLYLHITGRRPDGYHDLDSLVAFASVGDTVVLRPADAFSFTIDGPMAPSLVDDTGTNLVVAAAHSLAELTGRALDVAITLTKRLPVASGIGGGSADAAAVLRALARHWGLGADDPRLAQAAARHGQDVAVCLAIRNVYMTADGVAPAPALPILPVVLVNPNQPLSTPAAFRAFREGGYKFSPVTQLADAPATADALIEALQDRHNDFTPAATQMMPVVRTMLNAIMGTGGCRLSRMSGSGATCFGLYDNGAAARLAADTLRHDHPDWWVADGVLNGEAVQ